MFLAAHLTPFFVSGKHPLLVGGSGRRIADARSGTLIFLGFVGFEDNRTICSIGRLMIYSIEFSRDRPLNSKLLEMTYLVSGK